MNDNMDSGVPGQKLLFAGIWIVWIYIEVLPGSNVKANVIHGGSQRCPLPFDRQAEC